MQTGREFISCEHADTDFVSLAEAKLWLRRDDIDVDDSIITMLINGAIAMVSNLIGYELKESLVDYGFDSFTGGVSRTTYIENGRTVIAVGGNKLRIPSKVNSIETVSYVNSEGTLVEFADSSWIQDPVIMGDRGCSITFKSTNVTVTESDIKFIVRVNEGFTPANFPDDLKTAVLLSIAQYYDNRQTLIVGASVAEMPLGLRLLTSNYKVYAVR